jgi:hypothetical protein
MTTYPPLATQIGLVRQEISDLSLLQQRHETWSRQTDDKTLQKVHMQVASEFEQAVFEVKKLMGALKSMENAGKRNKGQSY